MAVLVTGGAGYIGSHTVRALRAAGREVVVLDTLEFGSERALLGARLIRGDIADRELVRSTCQRHEVEQVVHFAAYKAVGESMHNPNRYWDNNVAGSAAFIDAAVQAGVRDVVFSSSCSVYGTPNSVPVDENAPIVPQSVYAETKAMVERILGWYGRTHGLRSVSLRYFNAAGASRDSEIGEDWTSSTNLVPVVMKALLGAAPPVKVFGDDYPTADGTCIRDYIHVEDLADAHVKALDRLAARADGEAPALAINVGTGVGSSVLDVLAAAAVAGRPVPHEIVGRRAGDPVATYADPARAVEVLGWRAEQDLAEIVASAYRWHVRHSG